MNIASNLSTFLHDKNYFISLFDHSLHIYKYKIIEILTSAKIVISMEEFSITILGKNLYISKMDKEELLIKGDIYELKKNNN